MFGALLEFALVNYASRSDVHQAAAKQQQQRQAKWQMEQSAAESGQMEDGTTYGMVSLRLVFDFPLFSLFSLLIFDFLIIFCLFSAW